MNKNDYYHSFKTYFESRLETRFRSQAGRVNLANPHFKKIKLKQPCFDQFFSSESLKVFGSCFILG